MSSATEAAAGALVTPKRRRTNPLGEVALRGGSSNKAYRPDSGGSRYSSLMMPTRTEAKNRSAIYSDNRMSAESSSAQAVIARQQLLNPDQSNLKGIKDGYYARRWAMYYLYALFGVSKQKYWTECGLVEVAQAEIEAGKERAEVDEYFNPVDADEDPDKEAQQVGFEDDSEALGAPVRP